MLDHDLERGKFQSTLPAGEATFQPVSFAVVLIISIHASRGGSDNIKAGDNVAWNGFQSTLPAGEATSDINLLMRFVRFQSTLPAGEATLLMNPPELDFKFQSTLPAGEATVFIVWFCKTLQFQSTLPAGEATKVHDDVVLVLHISIHASRGGSDCRSHLGALWALYFNPRFPRGKRR